MKTKKIIVICFMLIGSIVFYVLTAFASNNEFGDINNIESVKVPSEYSHGILYWIDGQTNVQVIQSNNMEEYDQPIEKDIDGKANTEIRYKTKRENLNECGLQLLITNCATDKDGDVCDVRVKLQSLLRF